MGAAQGRALVRASIGEGESAVETLRRGAAWVLHWGGRSPASPISWGDRQALVRDLRRHFPHFSERFAALARAARRPPEWDALVDPSAPAFGTRVVEAGNGRLGCSLPPGRWLIRDVTLDGGHRSIGLAPPGWPAQIAGVNEAGLCGVALVMAPLFPRRAAATLPPAILAPGWLLLDQCLERCDRVESALRWCERRPGGGSGTLVFGDATGRCAGLRLEGNRRERCAPPVSPDSEARGDGNGAWTVCLDASRCALRVFGAGIAEREHALRPRRPVATQDPPCPSQ